MTSRTHTHSHTAHYTLHICLCPSSCWRLQLNDDDTLSDTHVQTHVPARICSEASAYASDANGIFTPSIFIWLDEQVFVPSAVCVRDHVFCVCIWPYLSVYVIIHSALMIRNSLALISHDIFAFKLICEIVLNSTCFTTSNGFWSVRLVQQFSVYAFYTHTQTRRCASKCLLNMKILVRTAYKTISETTHRHIRTHTFRFHIHMNETACMAAS